MTPVRVPLRRFYGWRPKVDKTIDDIHDGRLSFSSSLPVVISRLDEPRGGIYIIDGYHRVLEAIARGDKAIAAIIDLHVPRIERTGGAHRTFVDDKVHIKTYVRGFL